jgi:hypothetical protein
VRYREKCDDGTPRLEMSYLFHFRRLTSDETPPFSCFLSGQSDSQETESSDVLLLVEAVAQKVDLSC